MLLAAIGLRKNIPQISAKNIKRIRINSSLNSSLIMFQPEAAKKLQRSDITDPKIVNSVTKLLGDNGVSIAHNKKTNEHDHAYIDKITNEFCLQRTIKSSGSKSQHGNKVSAEIDILNKVEEMFDPENKLKCVQDVAHAYRYHKINGYNAVLSKDPTVKNRTLYFSLQVDQHDMSSSSFEKSECLIGVVMKNGLLVNVLIRDGEGIKKIFDDNLNIEMQDPFLL